MLKPREREILEHVLLEGRTVSEAAELLKIEEKNGCYYKKRYERALKKLADMLKAVET